MEPASVLAFVLVGLKSAKAAYEILSNFKDGPENVKRATADVEGLLLTLVQLSKCRALEKESSEALRASIDVCLGDIDSFVRELTKLTLEPQSSRRKQYWKRVMAMWEEKALSKMSARVASHASSLGLWLNVLQSDAVLDVPVRLDSISGQLATERSAREAHVAILTKQTTTLHSVEESIAHLSSGFGTMQAAVDTMSSACIPARLDLMSGELAAARIVRETHLAAVNEQRAALQGVEGGITSLGGGLQTMQAAVQTMSSAAAANQAEILASLEQVLQKVAGLSLGNLNQTPNRVVEAQGQGIAQGLSDQQKDAAKPEPCKELTNIITRLCNRVNDSKLQGRVMLGDAKGIVSDLLLALEMMNSEEFFQANVVPGLVDQGICSTCCEGHWADLRSTLTTVHAALAPTRQLRLNDTDRVRQRGSDTYGPNHWELSAYETDMGTLSVLTGKRSRNVQQLSELDEPSPKRLARTEEEEVTTTVSLVAARFQAPRAIKLRVRQTYNYDGVLSAIPDLMVYNVLPANSPVFDIVRRGRLQEFQALLRDGKASLRDQDEYGASLLFYANRQPEMCRFLIQSGADVNHVAKNSWEPPTIGSALDAGINDDEAGEDLDPILLCRRYLLEAGCDPTLPSLLGSEIQGDCCDLWIYFCVPKAIEILLDFGTGFVNANSTAEYLGLSLLSGVCSSGRWSAESIAVLLRRSADVTDRDDRGRTCLHHCFQLYRRWEFQSSHNKFPVDIGSPHPIHRFSVGLILLIQHGADVCAQDGFGHSVSTYAYMEPTGVNGLAELSSVRGDVWDFALARCGYDISEFRHKHGASRKARYSTRYTRQVFESLWAGHEHLCPYYNDEVHGVSDAGARLPRSRQQTVGMMEFEKTTTIGRVITEVSTDSEDDDSDGMDSEDGGAEVTTHKEDQGYTTF